MQGSKWEEPRALFLDRDGVINEEIGYLIRKQDVSFVEGIFPLCRKALGLGYQIIVVTNQSGIARGYYSEAQFLELIDWFAEQFSREDIKLTAVYYCPYHPEHGVGRYKREHEDRKPGAGMLMRAARDFHLSLAESVLVGDRCSDIQAANTAGLRHAFLLKGTEERECSGKYQEIVTLKEVETWLDHHT